MPEHQWLYKTGESGNGHPAGPIGTRDLIEKVKAGKIGPDAIVASPTHVNKGWHRVRQLPSLMRAWDLGVARRSERQRRLAQGGDAFRRYDCAAMYWQALDDWYNKWAMRVAVLATLMSAVGPIVLGTPFSAIFYWLLVITFLMLLAIPFNSQPRRCHIAARHAAEVLKSEIFSYAAAAGIYGDANRRDAVFDERKKRIEIDFRQSIGSAVFKNEGDESQSCLPETAFAFGGGQGLASEHDYFNERILDQKQGYFQPKLQELVIAGNVVLVLFLLRSMASVFKLSLLVMAIYAYLVRHRFLSGNNFKKTSYETTVASLELLEQRWKEHVMDEQSFREHAELVEMLLMHEHRAWQAHMESSTYDRTQFFDSVKSLSSFIHHFRHAKNN